MNLACPDWFERLQAGSAPFADFTVNETMASKALRIFGNLRLPDVPGEPPLSKAAGDWTGDLVRAVFGPVKLDEDGVVTERAIRKYLVLVPKKNAKTTTGAAIMLTALLMNRRPRAEYLLIGPTQQIAELAFSQAEGMIFADPEKFLEKRFQVQSHIKTIIDRTNKARLVIKTFDSKVVTGTKPAGVLIDELHELGKFAYAEKVMAQLRGGIIANPEAFLLMITTQSDSPPVGVFRSELDFARDIRDGKATGDMLPILYEFPVEMQSGDEEQQKEGTEPWRDPENWPLVLPNAGRSITVERLLGEYREAAAKGDDVMSIWASQHLNVEVGIALHKNRWVGANYWIRATDPEPITLDSLIERCEVIVAGIDGGGLDDMLGLCLGGRDKITGDWLMWHHAWIHPDALEQRKENVAHYQQFKADGDLTICEDATQDVREIAEIVGRVNDEGLLPQQHAVGLDAVGVAAVNDALLAAGLTAEQLAAVGQGYRLSGTIKGYERKLKHGTIWHDGSALMVWCVGNAKAQVKGSATLIEKAVAGKAKIDPLIASFNVFTLLARHPVAGATSTEIPDDYEVAA